MSIEDRNKEVISRFVEELYSQGKLDVADEIIHLNTRNPRGGGMWASGPTGVKNFVASARQSTPDLKRTVLDMVAEGDKVVLHSVFHGTHTGEGGFIPYSPTGASVEMTGVATFVLEDGKIIEEPWSNWDYSQLFGPTAKAFARKWFEEGWQSRSADAIDEYFHIDYVGHIHGDTPWRGGAGRDGVKGMFKMLWDSFPTVNCSVQDQIVEGDKIVNRILMTGIQEKEFMGLAPSGHNVSREGTATFRLNEGKFIEGWFVWGPFAAV